MRRPAARADSRAGRSARQVRGLHRAAAGRDRSPAPQRGNLAPGGSRLRRHRGPLDRSAAEARRDPAGHRRPGRAHSGRDAGGGLDPAGASQEAQPRRRAAASHERLHRRSSRSAWERNDSLVCVGLDPEIERLPASLAAEASPIFQFNKAIIDATADLVCAYKPQFAHYAAYEAEDQLERTIEYIHRTYPSIPVILDSKRGDVGNTAERYALEAFERYARRCGHRESVSRRRFARAVPEARGQGRHHPLPHVEPRRAGHAGSAGRLAPRCITSSPSSPRSAGIRAATACSSSARRIRASSPRCARSSATCRSSCPASARRAATWRKPC